MKLSRFIIVSLIFAAFLAVSANAQTPAVAAKKIGLIDTSFFLDDKAGIKKYIDAVNTINAEFKTAAAELDATALKLQNLEKEIKAMQDQAQKGVQINQTIANAKLEEYDKLSREYKFKKEDGTVRYNRRQEVLLKPIRQDISRAIQEFAGKNGYVVIFDISKDQNEMFIAWDEKADITKDFITFYNARPTPTVPK